MISCFSSVHNTLRGSLEGIWHTTAALAWLSFGAHSLSVVHWAAAEQQHSLDLYCAPQVAKLGRVTLAWRLQLPDLLVSCSMSSFCWLSPSAVWCCCAAMVADVERCNRCRGAQCRGCTCLLSFSSLSASLAPGCVHSLPGLTWRPGRHTIGREQCCQHRLPWRMCALHCP